MRPLPHLPRFLFDADSEIAPQNDILFSVHMSTTGLCSLFYPTVTRVLPPEPLTTGIMSIIGDKYRATHLKLRIAVQRYAPKLQWDGM